MTTRTSAFDRWMSLANVALGESDMDIPFTTYDDLSRLQKEDKVLTKKLANLVARAESSKRDILDRRELLKIRATNLRTTIQKLLDVPIDPPSVAAQRDIAQNMIKAAGAKQPPTPLASQPPTPQSKQPSSAQAKQPPPAGGAKVPQMGGPQKPPSPKLPEVSPDPNADGTGPNAHLTEQGVLVVN